jgi:hypothetical protein
MGPVEQSFSVQNQGQQGAAWHQHGHAPQNKSLEYGHLGSSALFISRACFHAVLTNLTGFLAAL